MRKGLRRLELIPFEANAPRGIPLPRDKKIKRIDLLFQAEAVVAGGAASGTVVEDAPLMLAPKVEIIGNGSIVLFRSDAQGQYYKKGYEYSTLPYLLAPTSGDEATYDIGFLMRIDFINNIGRNPEDSFLPSYKFNSLNLTVDWGDPDNMFEGTYDRACTISSAFGMRGVIEETSQPKPKYVRIQDYQEKIVTASQTDFYMDLTCGDHTYQAVMFKTMDDTVKESNIINLINLKRDDKHADIQNLPFIQGQHMNKLDYSMEAVSIDEKVEDGILYIPLTEEGMISTGLRTFGIQTCMFLMDVTVGTLVTKVRLYHDRLVPYKAIFPR